MQGEHHYVVDVSSFVYWNCLGDAAHSRVFQAVDFIKKAGVRTENKETFYKNTCA